MEPLKYDLPDFSIMEQVDSNNFFVWQPDDLYIVLGRANSIEKALHMQVAQEDNVKIFKRPTGGESVVLSPQMVVFSARFTKKQEEKPGVFFNLINSCLIEELSKLGIENLSSKGISDLSIGGKKIMGSSMYLKGDLLFYHAVINVSEDVSKISKYLKHPSKEPDYRKGRSHDEFVTSLHKEGYLVDNKEVMRCVESALSRLGK